MKEISPPGGCQLFGCPGVSGTMLAPPALSGFYTLLQPAESAAEAVIRCGGAGAGCACAAAPLTDTTNAAMTAATRNASMCIVPPAGPRPRTPILLEIEGDTTPYRRPAVVAAPMARRRRA